MAHRFLSFDIETAKVVEDGNNLEAERPLGISCWAIAWETSKGEIGTKRGCGLDADGNEAPQMSPEECQELVFNLLGAVDKGFTLLAHNGAAFDFYTLAEESDMWAECAALALYSVDTCFHVHCVKGFPVGLDAIAKGIGIQGKTEGMSGDLAPQMWAEGRYTEVLDYVEQDVRVALQIAREIERRQELRWVAKSGRTNNLPLERWLTVREAMELPLPDTSWMRDGGWPREKFIGWIQEDA